jgi:RND family efflux transporter MFP subunit
MKVRFGWPTMILLGAVGGSLAVGGLLYTHNTSRTNHVALASSAKRVGAIAAVAHPFQATRRYVGTIEPWVEAKVGPQLVSAYVDTVLVRPGAAVKRGEVLATLDCRNASATNRQVEAQARAEDATSAAAAKEAARVSQLLPGNYVSENEVDIRKADAASKEALQVDDCGLRAPFDGEIADRRIDPGAFVRPGAAIATVIDRHLVRVDVDVPEEDFNAVAPGTEVRLHLLSTGRDLVAKISRRAPSADPETRTAHVEIDLDDADRGIPVWTTAEISLDAGQPAPATAIPLNAASVHGTKATIFLVAGDTAHLAVIDVLGEAGGSLFLDPTALPAGSQVVTDGRTVLSDHDTIAATLKPWSPDEAPKK